MFTRHSISDPWDGGASVTPSSDHHPLGVTLSTIIGNDDTPDKVVNS